MNFQLIDKFVLTKKQKQKKNKTKNKKQKTTKTITIFIPFIAAMAITDV